MNYRIKLSVIIIIIFSFFSCTSTKKVQVVKTITKIKKDTVYINPLKNISLIDYKAATPEGYIINNDYYPSVGKDFRQKFLIMHYTALDNPKSLMVLSERNVSAHYVINNTDDNQINMLVSENERAWHAGVSFWSGRTNLNDSSIGIEIVNLGYEPYPNYQIKKVGALAKDIVERYKIDPVNVLGHSDIAPQRKLDPGPQFPWKQLYEEYGIGAWYDDYTKDFYQNQFKEELKNDTSFIKQFQNDLALYGYEIIPTGIWDEQTKKVIKVFQMHFRPKVYDGVLDAETWAILKALNLKYRAKS